jgi:tight adherence protein B
MEAASMIFLALAVAGAAVCAASALPMFFSYGTAAAYRTRRQSRLLDEPDTGSDDKRRALLAGLLRNGIPAVRPLSKLLLRSRWLSIRLDCCVSALGIKGLISSPGAVCELMSLALLVAALAVFLVSGQLAVALCCAVAMLVFAYGKARKTCDKWGEKMIEQIPDALRSLGICFNAGYSLQQALEQTAQDTAEPLGKELRQASNDVKAGRGIEEALSALEQRTLLADLRFALVALEIQHKTGGSLQQLLENAADAVLASADLRRQLLVQTAQARLSSKVVTILPLVLVALLSLAMPGYLSMFFSSSEGLFILLLAAAMEAAGILMIRKILGINLY